MSATTIDRRELSVIDRAAIHVGTTLLAWGRRRPKVDEGDPGERYRADYAERMRTASAIARHQLLP